MHPQIITPASQRPGTDERRGGWRQCGVVVGAVVEDC